ncbi:helix-turn-helix domain-containing protein [Streptomyces sp. NPDC056291]|uniref:helix-turn-helix domain-containing protein n=1 Tax=Streptomyces sp. NPDC056291 TaxID=3345772 RepID=UPI0035E1AD10
MNHPPQRRRRMSPLDHAPAAVTFARENAGLTKRALAEELGISEQLMNDIEAGRRNVTPANLRKLIEVLNCPKAVLQGRVVTAWTRTHCDCAVVQNYNYDEAAAKLKIKRRWLEDNISRLPHQKYGKNEAVFCDCDLRIVQAMHAVLPPDAEAAINPPEQTPAESTHPATASDVPSLAAIKPAKGRRREPAPL